MPRIRPNAVSVVTNLLSPAVCATAWRRTTPDVSANTDACLRKSRREGSHEFMAIVHSCCWDVVHYILARLEQVSRYFTPGRPALANVSLEVADREVVAIVGPSGCAKSTL